jgi:DNA invertase Pin-like site-specific DNA recombinase
MMVASRTDGNRERAVQIKRAGIDAAKAKGIYKGRAVTFDRARIVTLRQEGMGATEIATVVGCKRGNVYKTLKTAGLK